MSGETKKLQAVLNAQIGKGNVHNMVAAVQSRDQRIDFIGAAGIIDPWTGAAMTPDTPYFIASVTKMYTAAVVLQLYEEQCVDLDAPISQYLPASLTHGIHVIKVLITAIASRSLNSSTKALTWPISKLTSHVVERVSWMN